MRQVSRRAVVAAAVGSALLTGCTTSIDGSAAPPVSNVTAEEFPITGATDNDIDRLARNALDDLNVFWTEVYPDFFGEEFLPLAGGYWSVDSQDIDYSLYPEDTGIGCDEYPIDPAEVEGNAFYHRGCDVVAYDRALLQQQSDLHGAYIGPAIMAHEFGHLLQGPLDRPDGRFGFAQVTILNETQADCLAGAFTGWVAEGNAEHTTLRVQDLDDVLTGFIALRDPLGETDVDVQGAHGSGFDRASAFYEGYTDGVAACRDNYGPDRVFTLDEFQTQEDLDNEGNAPYSDVGGIIEGTLPVFYDSFLDGFEAPAIQAFDGTAPDCGDMGVEDRDVGYCAEDNTVYVDETDLLQPAYQEIGDFAVATAVALPYAEAARAHLGLPTDTPESTVSTVCLTGTYAARFFSGDFGNTEEGITLSPGDVDEAIQFLLTYGQTDAVLPNTEATGFDLVGAFRDGFLEGAGACGL